MPDQQAETVLHHLRQRLETDLIAFLGTRNSLAPENHPGLIELVVAAGTSQFDILRRARTDAINYDLDTEDLIRTLVDIDRRYGIIITQVESAVVVFDLRSTPPDMLAFTEEIHAFCPDIVLQGVESIEALAEGIEVTGRV